MRIISLSEDDVMMEFNKTGLPKSSYTIYRKYLEDLDIYYYIKDLDSPRMSKRIYSRAALMTQCFNQSIEMGHSIRLADHIARNFIENADSYIQGDMIRFLSKYLYDNGITEYKDMVRELVGDDEDIEALISGKEGNKPTSSTFALMAHYIYLYPGITSGIISKLESEVFIDIKAFPYEQLDEIIIILRRLLKNRHLRRHANTSINKKFIWRKLSSYVIKAEVIFNECKNILLENDGNFPANIINNVNYLLCLIETIKDIYRLY